MKPLRQNRDEIAVDLSRPSGIAKKNIKVSVDVKSSPFE